MHTTISKITIFFLGSLENSLSISLENLKATPDRLVKPDVNFVNPMSTVEGTRINDCHIKAAYVYPHPFLCGIYCFLVTDTSPISTM